jgi:hypothetical protein
MNNNEYSECLDENGIVLNDFLKTPIIPTGGREDIRSVKMTEIRIFPDFDQQ